MNPCYICRLDTTSHSFHIIDSSNQNIHLFYSCPAKATKYFEHSGVIEHFIVHLDKNNHHPWGFILDCNNFTLQHAAQIYTILELTNMIQNNHGKSLKKIWIINYTWTIKIIMEVILLVLEDDLKNSIEITDKTTEEIQRLVSI